MKAVVITGSTRGIGFGLADSFLAEGCAVVVSGRTQAAVDEAVSRLAAGHDTQRVLGKPCDVSDYAQVQALWDAAVARFGHVDIWINNAGIAHPVSDFQMLPPEQMKTIVETNILGAMYGSRVALNGMKAQGFGSLYSMEGLGSSGGRQVRGLSIYGTTKAALRYLNDALMIETKGTPIIVGALQPGMTLTDLLTKQYQDQPEAWERFKRILNILSDRVETVTPWLARKVLSNTRGGARFAWVSRAKITWRFMTAPFIKRKVVE
jgi:NAD(P)-dependent dehydrogenase (short-subunit alcohol dehydrogenase family)